jgi:cobalt-zinc-cadmium efflux system protein
VERFEIEPSDVGVAMAHAPEVREVHDLHLWELAPGHPILTAHVLVARAADCHAVRRALDEMLHDQFNIDHTTLQVEHAHDPANDRETAAIGFILSAIRG